MSNDSVEFEFDAGEDDSEEVCNISSQPARLHIDNLKIVLKPGQRVRVPKAYVRRHAMQPGRDPVASAIHMMTDGRVVPSSDPRVPKLPSDSLIPRVNPHTGLSVSTLGEDE